MVNYHGIFISMAPGVNAILPHPLSLSHFLNVLPWQPFSTSLGSTWLFPNKKSSCAAMIIIEIN
jgi:hypothetical protein